MSPCSGLVIRRAQPHDWERVTAVMPEWWGGRDLRALLPSIFFEHFRTTSFIAERDEALLGFLVGFLCPTHADEAYIHFAGIHPDWRRVGLARDLYGRFCEVARADGRHCVRAVTSVVNHDSIAFHQRLGFVLLPGDFEVDGLPAVEELGVPEGAIVRFELRLDDLAAPATVPTTAPTPTNPGAPDRG